MDAYPRELNNKVYLLKHFESYMLDRLFGDQDYTYEDKELTKGMVFVTRYLRMKHVILFRLSNNVLQVIHSSPMFTFAYETYSSISTTIRS